MEIGLQRLMREQGSGRETTKLDINSFSDSFAGEDLQLSEELASCWKV